MGPPSNLVEVPTFESRVQNIFQVKYYVRSRLLTSLRPDRDNPSFDGPPPDLHRKPGNCFFALLLLPGSRGPVAYSLLRGLGGNHGFRRDRLLCKTASREIHVDDLRVISFCLPVDLGGPQTPTTRIRPGLYFVETFHPRIYYTAKWDD